MHRHNGPDRELPPPNHQPPTKKNRNCFWDAWKIHSSKTSSSINISCINIKVMDTPPPQIPVFECRLVELQEVCFSGPRWLKRRVKIPNHSEHIFRVGLSAGKPRVFEVTHPVGLVLTGFSEPEVTIFG